MMRSHPFRTLSIAFFTLFSLSSCADKKSNDALSDASSSTISTDSRTEAPSIRAMLLPRGIEMTFPENFSGDEARKAAPGIPDSAPYVGSFKLQGSGALNGQEIKVEVNKE